MPRRYPARSAHPPTSNSTSQLSHKSTSSSWFVLSLMKSGLHGLVRTKHYRLASLLSLHSHSWLEELLRHKMHHVSFLIKILEGTAIAFRIKSTCSSTVEGTSLAPSTANTQKPRLCLWNRQPSIHSLTPLPPHLPPYTPSCAVWPLSHLSIFVTTHPGKLPDPQPSLGFPLHQGQEL